ncbi:MAG: methionine adenosyltransferase [Candidatus Methanofastidiosa archaeon]|nr:methionine adenosyltransferase [Candidatus Methanofastidiosa archaeon]HOM95968.1 methionine adenosyltransferase [Methanofastidiosum sp.]HPC81116.1 methionine adenosyltransferase [Methanofastidiosum sp.]HRS25632.1 methionine adenosyltransferase [Methanofastidiosum sp.]
MKNIYISPKFIKQGEFELVERKGVGHPDSIADGIAQKVSNELSKYYIKKFGRIMHHNTDQVEVIGGTSISKFGGGEIIKDPLIILSGRATQKVGDEIVPIHEIAKEATDKYLKELFRGEIRIGIESFMGEGSSDLKDVFGRKNSIPLSNDTSFGVSFYPFTKVEQLVFDIENFLNSDKMNKKYPAIGRDIKVMGARIKDNAKITIALATVDKYVENIKEYVTFKEQIIEILKDKFGSCDVDYYINTADDVERGSAFLTVTGSSMENGDDGSVGRGNRVNGLITPYKPMSMEAAAGKNPINHVGKLYNVLSLYIARDIYHNTNAGETQVKILSQIGKPINEPLVCDISTERELSSEAQKEVRKIASDWLDNIKQVTEDIINEKVNLF